MSKGKSDEQALQTKSDTFERDQLDEFKVSLEKVGKPYKIRVWHDNSGMMAAWYLDYIELQHVGSGAVYRFDCQAWLSLRDGNDIVREIPASGSLIKTPAAVGKALRR